MDYGKRFRFPYALRPKLKGSVPRRASTSEQQDVVLIEMDGGASTSRQQDDVVMEMDGGSSTSRQQDDVVMEMDGGTSTSRQQDDVVMEMDGGAFTGGQHVHGIEEETHSNVDQERVEWVTSIQTKLDEYTRSQAAETETISIPRVKGPKGFYQRVDKAYEPRVISIGPYHRGKPHLQSMQKHKWQCLKDIRDQNGGILFDLNDYFKELKEQENRARRFYPESNKQLKRGDFLEMLLVDGCFIVDYLRCASTEESKTRIWSDDQIRNDLLLLENQLPFFVVECIYRLVKHTNDNKTLVEIAMKLFHNISPKDLGVYEPDKRNFKHLLHLYHAYLFFDEHHGWKENRASQVRTIPSGASQVRTIPSASFLEEAGIKFKMRKMKDKVINVRFKDGIMNITPLVIDAFTISQFLNLIEFERAHPDMEPRFTAFLQFMDYIINTSEDVALLRKNGILEHAFGSDEEVAGIFNRLTSGTFHQLPWELKNVYEKADRHCKAKWNRWRATLLRDYFGNPWAAIAILAAVLLLSFGFIQSFFSAYSYFRPSSKS